MKQGPEKNQTKQFLKKMKTSGTVGPLVDNKKASAYVNSTFNYKSINLNNLNVLMD